MTPLPGKQVAASRNSYGGTLTVYTPAKVLPMCSDSRFVNIANTITAIRNEVLGVMEDRNRFASPGRNQ
jgi:hypothetical protein